MNNSALEVLSKNGSPRRRELTFNIRLGTMLEWIGIGTFESIQPSFVITVDGIGCPLFIRLGMTDFARACLEKGPQGRNRSGDDGNSQF